MFSALDEKDLAVVIDAMDQRSVKVGQNVIVEGETGDELFVVEEGSLDCFKQFVSHIAPNFTSLMSMLLST